MMDSAAHRLPLGGSDGERGEGAERWPDVALPPSGEIAQSVDELVHRLTDTEFDLPDLPGVDAALVNELRHALQHMRTSYTVSGTSTSDARPKSSAALPDGAHCTQDESHDSSACEDDDHDEMVDDEDEDADTSAEHARIYRQQRTAPPTHAIEKKCKCASGTCLDSLPRSTVQQIRAEYDRLSQHAKRIACQSLLATCVSGAAGTPPKGKPRKSRAKRHHDDSVPVTTHRLRPKYCVLGATLCKTSFMKVTGMGSRMIANALQDLRNEHVVPTPTKRPGNTKNVKHPRTKFALAVIDAIARVDGLPNPGQRGPMLLLPVDKTKKAMHEDYLRVHKDTSPSTTGGDALSYGDFVYVWRRHMPWVASDKHRTDLCNRCMELRRTKNHVQLKLHLLPTRLERAFYHAHARFAALHANTLALSMDKAGTCRLPHLTQEPKDIYYTTGLAVDVFGIANLGTAHQVNYVVPETQRAMVQGADFMVSLLHHVLEGYPEAERVYILADNTAAQNKNNCVMQYLSARSVLRHQEIILHFMIPGHTKAANDAHFGVFKHAFKNKDVYNPRQFMEVIDGSSRTNSAVDASTVKQSAFSQSFERAGARRIAGISDFHHFWFRPSAPGAVQLRARASEEWYAYTTLFRPSSISEDLFSHVAPLERFHISKERQQDLRALRDKHLAHLSHEDQQNFFPDGYEAQFNDSHGM
ncbi:hypothetical protein PTSG_07843 [Salpingoeca rosetta]|uniref:DUF7869 domain-containing protein n=1 Tax=Salpingoeca rosetta (strain ATCC 50818 / BSB-021) TaxID=946362 RepID=F2UGH7_SALR5|nr:uncharacterized protein PTSG_07843 [Salpingoeca rosetta]EGD75727.1 hypothetical protein PTSG_07843 [Salpingoeca rosetta]|eukprot:XP_004991648.1 hypothetical protein PTSG_07843 [Salpingoeca rosetta]